MKYKILFKIIMFLQIFQLLIVAQTLELEFYLDKEVYLVGEPIVGIVLLKNNGNDVNIPYFGFQSGLVSELLDQNDKRITERRDIIICVDGTVKQQLKSGETRCDFLNITYKYGIADSILSFDGLSSKRRFLQLGNYKLNVIYKNEAILNGPISKTIEFSVINPTLRNDAGIYNALSLTSKEFKLNKNYDLYYENLKNIIANKSASDYKIIAYTKLIFELNLSKKKNDALEIFEQMLEDYPDKISTYMVSTVFWNSKKDFFHRPEIQEKIKKSKVFNYLFYYLSSYNLLINE